MRGEPYADQTADQDRDRTRTRSQHDSYQREERFAQGKGPTTSSQHHREGNQGEPRDYRREHGYIRDRSAGNDRPAVCAHLAPRASRDLQTVLCLHRR